MSSMGFIFLTTLLLSLSYPSLSHNPPSRLEKAYKALHAWKNAITCDPHNTTSNWWGPNVCKYTGVYCSHALDDPNVMTVSGIDLNHGEICGTLPNELGLLDDLALIHLNSNKFTGTIPSLRGRYLHEVDFSNNQFSGQFPKDLLSLPTLKYIDVRFNKFEGNIPDFLFEKDLDAVFVNNNNFGGQFPFNIVKSKASVLVLANIKLEGCIPRSIGNMAETLNEIILSNAGLSSCLPEEIGKLKKTTVFDVSRNALEGPLPNSIGEMQSLEILNVAHNKLSGVIPQSICKLPKLEEFTYNDNYFTGAPFSCMDVGKTNDKKNCIKGRNSQRPENQCKMFAGMPKVCKNEGECVKAVPVLPPPKKKTPCPPPPPKH